MIIFLGNPNDLFGNWKEILTENNYQLKDNGVYLNLDVTEDSDIIYFLQILTKKVWVKSGNNIYKSLKNFNIKFPIIFSYFSNSKLVKFIIENKPGELKELSLPNKLYWESKLTDLEKRQILYRIERGELSITKLN